MVTLQLSHVHIGLEAQSHLLCLEGQVFFFHTFVPGLRVKAASASLLEGSYLPTVTLGKLFNVSEFPSTLTKY